MRARSANVFLASLAALSATLSPAVLATYTTTWNGGPTGNWSTGPWLNAGPSSFSDVVIDGKPSQNTTVALDVSQTINGLTIDAGDALNFKSPQTLSLNGDAQIDGSLTTTSGPYNTIAFHKAGAVTVGGGGTITLVGTTNTNAINNAAGNGSVGYALTLGSGVKVQGSGTINGAYTGLSGQTLVNNGTILSNGGTSLFIEHVDNHGTIAAATGNAITLFYWNNAAGTLNASGGKIYLTGVFNSADVGTLATSAGGAIIIAGNFYVNGVFAPTATGQVTLSGGQIIGGTLSNGGSALVVDNGGGAPYGGGTLSSAAINPGALLFHGSGSTPAGIAIVDGLTLNGGAILGLSDGSGPDAATIGFTSSVDRHLAGSGTVSLGTAGNGMLANNSPAGHLLTLDAGITVHGAGSILGAHATPQVAGQHIVNWGTIYADVPGKALYVSDVANTGKMSVAAGSAMLLSGAWSNAGTITAAGTTASPATLDLGGRFSNTGTLNVSNASVNLSGTFTRADLGTVNRSGNTTVNLTGTLDVSATTPSNPFAPDAVLGPVNLAGGRVFGGTGTQNGAIGPGAGGAMNLTNDSTLDHLTLNPGGLTLNAWGLTVYVQNGLTLNNGAGLDLSVGGPGYNTLKFQGTTDQMLAATNGGATIRLGGSTSSTCNVLNASYASGTGSTGGRVVTFGPGVTIRGGGNVNGSTTAAGQRFINQGTIVADAPDKPLYISAIDNQGSLAATGGARLAVSSNLLNLSADGTLTGGTYDVGAASTLQVQVGAVTTNAGTIKLTAAGAAFQSGPSGAMLESTLTTNATGGTLQVGAGRTFTVTAAPGLTNNGQIILTGGGIGATTSLTNAAGAQISGTGAITSPVQNLGIIRAAGGTLTVAGTTGGGTLAADAGATLAVAGGARNVLAAAALNLAGTTGNWTAKLDLADGGLALDYPAGGASPLAVVGDQVRAGYASGAWAGNGIASANAAASGGRGAVGFGEAGAVLNIAGAQTATFMGRTVDASTVLARYTSYGDANLDGSVDFADFVQLSNHFGTGVPNGWSSGDFNFDGKIDFADFVLLSNNFGTVAPANAPAVAATVQGTQSSVPEPGSVLLTTFAAGGLLARRRPRCR